MKNKLPCSLLQGIPSGKFVLRHDTPQQSCGVFRSQNKGFALLTILFLGMILFFIELALFTTSETHHQVMDSQLYDTKSYYLSQAGFYDALTQLRTNTNIIPSITPSTPYHYSIVEDGKTINITISDAGGGNYQIKTSVDD